MVPSDFKAPARIRDDLAAKRKLVRFPICRNCPQKATDAHHILLRSQGGDDVEDNLIPLCRQHHFEYHNADISVRVNLDEKLYVLTKLGQVAGMDYLERRRYEL